MYPEALPRAPTTDSSFIEQGARVTRSISQDSEDVFDPLISLIDFKGARVPRDVRTRDPCWVDTPESTSAASGASGGARRPLFRVYFCRNSRAATGPSQVFKD
jgi:hypothetical protein